MDTAKKYIRIVEIAPKPKTKVWEVRNIRTNEVCGIIKWYGGFRKYAFFPTDGFFFDMNCLQAIAAHLQDWDPNCLPPKEL
jgi:hypothetical protein